MTEEERERSWKDFALQGGERFSHLSRRQKIGAAVVVLSAALATRHFLNRRTGEEEEILFPGDLEDDEMGLEEGDVAQVLERVDIEPGELDRLRQPTTRFGIGVDSVLSILRRRDESRQRARKGLDPHSSEVKEAMLSMVGDALSDDEREELSQSDWGTIMGRLEELD